MNPEWSPRLKLFYAVVCLVLFTAAMMLVGKYVATPFQDWLRPYLEASPTWLIAAGLIAIVPLWYLAWWNAKRSQRANARRPY